jgi:membrane associated rhomboid family serine protease
LSNYRRPGFGGFSLFPPVIKYLLISNIAIFLLQHFFFAALKAGSVNIGDEFVKNFALFGINSPFFRPWQIFTYMYLHGSFSHLFFNMFALWMFGLELENLWGSKKFLLYYTICGLGAGIANLFLAPLFTTIPPNVPTVGASGSIYGVLVAFGYLFPNRHIYIYFMIPIKAKYLVILYMAIEVFSVASQSATGIAHIAHLGGAVVGFVYLFYTEKHSRMNLFKFGDTGNLSGLFSGFNKKKQDSPKSSAPWKKEPPAKSSAGTPKKNSAAKEVYSANKNSAYEDVNDHKYENDMRRKEKEAQVKIDDILDKLSANGYSSLSEEEKRVLFHESKKLR